MSRRQLGYLSWLSKVTVRGSMEEKHRLFIRYHPEVVALYRITRSGLPHKAQYRLIGKVPLHNFPKPTDVLNLATNLGAVIHRVSNYSTEDKYDWIQRVQGEDLFGYHTSVALKDSGRMGSTLIVAYDHKVYPATPADPRYVPRS